MILFRCAKRSILPDRITLLEVTSTGASFDLLRHRKRARKVTVRIPQRKVAKFKLRIATSFSIFSEKSGTKTFMAAVYSRFYKSVEKDLGMGTGKKEILKDYFSRKLTLKITYQLLWEATIYWRLSQSPLKHKFWLYFSSQRQLTVNKRTYICGLGARFGYERV